MSSPRTSRKEAVEKTNAETHECYKSVTELKKERARMIKKLDFDGVAEIDKKIEALLKANSHSDLSAYEEKIRAFVGEKFEDLVAKIDKIEDQTDDLEMKIKVEIDVAYQNMKDKHLTDLTDLGKFYELEKEKERKRRSVNVKKLIKELRQPRRRRRSSRRPRARRRSLKYRASAIRRWEFFSTSRRMS